MRGASLDFPIQKLAWEAQLRQRSLITSLAKCLEFGLLPKFKRTSACNVALLALTFPLNISAYRY